MPHPERLVDPLHHPRWNALGPKKEGDGPADFPERSDGMPIRKIPSCEGKAPAEPGPTRLGGEPGPPEIRLASSRSRQRLQKCRHRLGDLFPADGVEVIVLGTFDDERRHPGLRGSGGECLRHRGGDERVLTAVTDQDRARHRSIFERLSDLWRKRIVESKGKLRRIIAVIDVNVLKTTNPAPVLREARSIATAPPSERPATMIRLGSMSLRVNRWS